MPETIFFQHLSKNKEKLKLFQKGIEEGLITPFDPTVLTRLRKIYYSFYSGLLYLYVEPTDFETIGNKIEILTHVFENDDYRIIHADTDSTREIHFNEYNSKHLDFSSFIEIKRGHKTYVYDPFSLLCFEKSLFYQLEQPQIRRIVPKEIVQRNAFYQEDNFRTPRDTWMLVSFLPRMEKLISKSPYKDFLEKELTRYKEEVSYEDVVLDWKVEENMIKNKKAF